MDIFIIICLIGIIAIFIATLIRITTLEREKRLMFLKNFKKGSFLLIFIFIFPLYWLGIFRQGQELGAAFLQAIRSCVDLAVLKYDYHNISNLFNNNQLYRFTIYVCFVMVSLNAVFFTLTLIGRRLSNYLRKQFIKIFAKRINIIVGFNEENKLIVKSIEDSEENVLILTLNNEFAEDFAYIHRAMYANLSEQDNLGSFIGSYLTKINKKTINVIINSGSDDKNLILVEELSALLIKQNLIDREIDDLSGLNVYVFGNPENAHAFLHYEEKTKGAIHYINKYKLIALDFIRKYPITEFMGEKHIDPETATIKPDVEMNVLLIGFGKTNQQIFLTSVANNQCLSKTGEQLSEKPINYWIYDKQDSRNNKNLNHNYYRYVNELETDPDLYLPLPPKPAHEEFFALDINDKGFYESIHHHLKGKEGSKPYNYLIIAYGTDMENLDFAEKISIKIKEWNLDKVTKVFTKIRCDKLTKQVINKEYAQESGFIAFANEQEIIYNLKEIVNERMQAMARSRHLAYMFRNATSEVNEGELKKEALQKWYRWAQVQRESNIYAILSIRFKLHLLGFDCVLSKEEKPSANEEYQKHYQKGDPIQYLTTSQTNNKPMIVYSNKMVAGSLREVLAIQEHQRWNAYMISCGFIPSTIEQIKTEGSKNFAFRRHGNITTFAGLVEFRKMIAQKENRSEEDTDVIRYDYQLMDDLVWLLTLNDEKIIKRFDK